MKITDTQTDEQLIKHYMNGDSSAFGVLVNRHKTRIYASIYTLVKDEHLADDIFQDVFIRIIESLKKGAYMENGKFVSWALRIAHNLSMDHFRKQKRSPAVRMSVDLELYLGYHHAEAGVDTKMILKDDQNNVRSLIDYLPEEQREIVILRHYANLSFKEIAEISNVSINTALGRMRYALMNIRKMMPEANIAC